MKLKSISVGLLAVVWAFIACTDNPVISDFETDHKANFSAEIVRPQTRAQDATWEASDAIGIYALHSGKDLTDDNIFDGKSNIKYVTTATVGTGTFEPENSADIILFPMNGKKLDFIAYYPHVENSKITDFTIPLDVSNQTDISAIDFLYAKVLNKDNTNKDVKLPFSHKLSKVVVELIADTDVDLTDATVIFKNVIVKGIFDLKNGKTTKSEEVTDIADLTPNKKGNTATALLLPEQDISQVAFVITLKNGKIYEWKAPETYLLKAGKSITYTLTLTAQNKVKVDASGEISDWEDDDNGQDVIVEPKKDEASGLLFAGADFEDWTAFESSLNNYGVKYAIQSNEGRNNTKAFYLNKIFSDTDAYEDIFTAKVPENFTVPNKITLYIKGTSPDKSLTFIVYTSEGKKYFRLGNCNTEAKTLNPSSAGYTGAIDTNGQWVKITLDLSAIKGIVETTEDNNLFVLRLGKSTYNLYIDDITVE